MDRRLSPFRSTDTWLMTKYIQSHDLLPGPWSTLKRSRTLLFVALMATVSVWIPIAAEATEPTASISGNITFVGAPASGVSWSIAALEYWGEGFDGGVMPPGAVVTKSGSGAFSISNLRPGYDVTLCASVRFGNANGWWPDVYLGGAASIGAAEVIRLAAGEHRSVSMTVSPGAKMAGKMTLEDGTPVTNGMVGVWTAGTGYVNSSVAMSTSTNIDGEWSLVLPLDSYKVGFTNGQSAATNGGLKPAVGGLHNQWFNDRPPTKPRPVFDWARTAAQSLASTPF